MIFDTGQSGGKMLFEFKIPDRDLSLENTGPIFFFKSDASSLFLKVDDVLLSMF